MSDLIKRLRSIGDRVIECVPAQAMNRVADYMTEVDDLCNEAADRVADLVAERETLNRCLFQAQEAAKDLAEQLRAAREQEPVAHIDDLGHIQFNDGGKLKRGDRLYAAPAPVPQPQEARDAEVIVLSPELQRIAAAIIAAKEKK